MHKHLTIILAILLAVSIIGCGAAEDGATVQKTPTRQLPRATRTMPAQQPSRQPPPPITQTALLQPTATSKAQPTSQPTINPQDSILCVDLGSEGVKFWDAFLDPYGQGLVVIREDEQAQVYHLSDGWSAVFPLPGEFFFTSGDISIQSDKIIVAEYTANNEIGDINLWQLTPGDDLKKVSTISETDGWLTALMFSPDGKTLAVGYNLGEIRLYRTSDGSRLRTIKGFNDFVTSMAYSRDGKYIVADSLSFDPNTYVFNASSGATVTTLTNESWEQGVVSFSPDGRLVASPQMDGTHVYSTGTWLPSGAVIAGVWHGAFSCDSGSFKETWGETTSFFSLSTGSLVETVEAGPLYCLPDGRSVKVDMDFTNSIITLLAAGH